MPRGSSHTGIFRRYIWRSILPQWQKDVFQILDKTDLAAIQPGMGSTLTQFSPTARVLVEGRHIVIYEPVEYGVFIVAIVHGARDAANWL